LPPNVRSAADKAYNLWRDNKEHPSLQFKPIEGEVDVWEARITLGYRAVCTKESDGAWVWFWIGTHNDFDSMFGS